MVNANFRGLMIAPSANEPHLSEQTRSGLRNAQAVRRERGRKQLRLGTALDAPKEGTRRTRVTSVIATSIASISIGIAATSKVGECGREQVRRGRQQQCGRKGDCLNGVGCGY